MEEPLDPNPYVGFVQLLQLQVQDFSQEQAPVVIGFSVALGLTLWGCVKLIGALKRWAGGY